MGRYHEQPREPAGSPKGGEWASAKGGPGTYEYDPEDDSYLYTLHNDPAFERWGANGPTKSTHEALSDFWGNNNIVNGLLRKQISSKEAATMTTSDTSGIISRLDKAFETAPTLKVPATVYRGVDISNMKLMEGTIFEDQGYACSSMDQPLVTRWVRGKQPAVMSIRMPKGTQYLPGDSEMAEIIPNRGSKFKILKITPREGKPTLIDMEML